MGKIPDAEAGSVTTSNEFIDPPDAGAAQRLRVDQPSSNREADQPGSIVNIQLLHDTSPVAVRCLNTDSKDCGNLLRRLSFRNKLKDLTFA